VGTKVPRAVYNRLVPFDQGVALPPVISGNEPKAPAASQWRLMLAQIPTIFGRLAYLASLRDPATGRYQHSDLISMLGSEDADRALRHSHHQVFSQWLTFNLAAQKSDLDEYLRTSGGRQFPGYYRTLVPPTARDVERQLYITDLETLMELLRCERAGDAGIPEASPPQLPAR